MQLHSIFHQPVRGKLALAPAALLATSASLFLAASPLLADNEAKSPAAKPSVPVSENTARKGSSPGYWSGSYWDAQAGNSFWHQLKPEARRSPKFGSGSERKPAANGSIRVRDENRAREH